MQVFIYMYILSIRTKCHSCNIVCSPLGVNGRERQPCLRFFCKQKQIKSLAVDFVIKLKLVGNSGHMGKDVTFYTLAKAVY